MEVQRTNVPCFTAIGLHLDTNLIPPTPVFLNPGLAQASPDHGPLVVHPEAFDAVVVATNGWQAWRVSPRRTVMLPYQCRTSRTPCHVLQRVAQLRLTVHGGRNAWESVPVPCGSDST